jgi:glucose/arabinose dehydrogenase
VVSLRSQPERGADSAVDGRHDNQVVRYPYRDGDTRAKGPAEVVIAHIPTKRHWTRDLATTRDGNRLFLAVGSASNLAGDMPDLTPDQIREHERTHGRGASTPKESAFGTTPPVSATVRVW